MRKCIQCGMELPEYAKFCAYCGAKLIAEEKNVQEIPYKMEGRKKENQKEDTIQDTTKGVYAFGEKIEGKKVVDFYVKIVEKILQRYPRLIGKFEGIFSQDKNKIEKYSGVPRYIEIEGKQIAINTGNSTNVKKGNLKKLSLAVGLKEGDIVFDYE